MFSETSEIAISLLILIIDASSEFYRVDLRNTLWTRTQLGPSFDKRPALHNSRIMPELENIFGDFMDRALVSSLFLPQVQYRGKGEPTTNHDLGITIF